MSRRFKKKKKDFFDKADLSKLESSPVTCPHFGECGGCRFQNISYDSQLELKKDYLKSLFDIDIDVTPAPSAFGYRNRMDFVYTRAKYGLDFDSETTPLDDNLLGMRKKGDFKTVVDLSECSLIPVWGNAVFKTVKHLLSSYSVDSYDFLEHDGFLRYLTLRFVPSTKETMVIFTSAKPRSNDEREKLVSLMNELSSKDDLLATSIYWFINDSLTDIAVPNVDPEMIIGKETLIETIDNTSLSFGPKSFFQVNSEVSSQMFRKIKEFTSGSVVDVCCGVGSISLFVSDSAKSILGIEEVEQAIVLARENALINDVSKAHFFTLPMKKLLDVTPMEVDTLIVDPPRSGLEKKVVNKLLELLPEKIIYMSCNPKTQKMDIDLLTSGGNYKLTYLHGWDMFPQTTHVETLCVLEHIS